MEEREIPREEAPRITLNQELNEIAVLLESDVEFDREQLAKQLRYCAHRAQNLAFHAGSQDLRNLLDNLRILAGQGYYLAAPDGNPVEKINLQVLLGDNP